MADWSVNIIQTKSGASFVVDFPNAKQGQPLDASQDDLVSWYNQTDDSHQPWQTDATYAKEVPGGALTPSIPAGQSSDTYDCAMPASPPQQAQWTVYYHCKNHPNNPLERGSINVKALAQEAVNILDTPKGTTFSPQARSASSKDPVNWNNLSAAAHQPWQTDQNYNPAGGTGLAGIIRPGDTSLVYFVNPPQGKTAQTGWTVYYCCKLHPNAASERGTIVVPPQKN